jgi:hypothetical protein
MKKRTSIQILEQFLFRVNRKIAYIPDGFIIILSLNVLYTIYN